MLLAIMAVLFFFVLATSDGKVGPLGALILVPFLLFGLIQIPWLLFVIIGGTVLVIIYHIFSKGL